jgi:hypothetical protein
MHTRSHRIGSRGRVLELGEPKKLRGIDYLGNLTNDGILDAFSNELKALVAFIYVYCGHKDTFADFDRGKGFSILVEALMTISERIPDVNIEVESEAEPDDEPQAKATDEDEPTRFVVENASATARKSLVTNKKRFAAAEDANTVEAKKPRLKLELKRP